MIIILPAQLLHSYLLISLKKISHIQFPPKTDSPRWLSGWFRAVRLNPGCAKPPAPFPRLSCAQWPFGHDARSLIFPMAWPWMISNHRRWEMLDLYIYISIIYIYQLYIYIYIYINYIYISIIYIYINYIYIYINHIYIYINFVISCVCHEIVCLCLFHDYEFGTWMKPHGESDLAHGAFFFSAGWSISPSKSCMFFRSQNSTLVGGWATPLKNMKVNWDD